MAFKVQNWLEYEAGLRRGGSLTCWIGAHSVKNTDTAEEKGYDAGEKALGIRHQTVYRSRYARLAACDLCDDSRGNRLCRCSGNV